MDGARRDEAAEVIRAGDAMAIGGGCDCDMAVCVCVRRLSSRGCQRVALDGAPGCDAVKDGWMAVSLLTATFSDSFFRVRSDADDVRRCWPNAVETMRGCDAFPERVKEGPGPDGVLRECRGGWW